MDEFKTYVGRYHTSHRKPYTYFGATRSNFNGIGVELEFDSEKPDINIDEFRDQAAKLLAERSDFDHYFIERDSSLRYGFEIVTQPHTVEAMKEFFTGFSEVFPKLLEIGATDEARSSGLHVHVSRGLFGETDAEQIDRIAKVICFLAHNEEDWIKSGRRREVRKCGVLPLKTKEEAINYVTETYGVELLKRRKIDRYVAVNLRNVKTVEYRTMQSSFCLDKIFAEIDFVMYLTERSATIDWKDVASASIWFNNLPQNVVDYLRGQKAFESSLNK